MHDPRSVANFLLDTRRFLGGTTTPLELQKLLFFCHASYLIGQNEPLVAGSFEAWEYGPVHPIVYRAFSSFGKEPIAKRAHSVNVVTGQAQAIPRPEKMAQRHVVKVVSALFDMSPGRLVDLSHAKNGPWDVVWRQRDSKGAIISDRTIKEHYAHQRLPLRAVEDLNAGVDIQDVPPYHN